MRWSAKKLIVVIHDPNPFTGSGVVASLRRFSQLFVLRALVRISNETVVTLEPDLIRWVPQIPLRQRAKVWHIPAGSNIPSGSVESSVRRPFTVSVFGVTERDRSEAQLIGSIARESGSKLGGIRLQVFGRGAITAAPEIRNAIGAAPVELVVEDILSADEVAVRLAATRVLLFVRGASSRRGTLIAAITRGLPAVATRGPETGSSIERSGVVLVRPGDASMAAQAIVSIARVPDFSTRLSQRSASATQAFFSWDAIANMFEKLLA